MSAELEALRKESMQKSEYITAHKRLIQLMLYEAIAMDEVDTEEEAVAAIRTLRQRAEAAEKKLAGVEPMFQIVSKEEFARRQQCADLKEKLDAAKSETEVLKETIVGIYKHIFAKLPEIESPQGNRLQNIAARCTLAVPDLETWNPREAKASP